MILKMTNKKTSKQKQKLAKEMSVILKRIANPTRLMILCQIVENDKNVSEILEHVEVSQSALSQHLTLMKKYKIIKDEKYGKFVFYSIKDQKIKKILGSLSEICGKKLIKK